MKKNNIPLLKIISYILFILSPIPLFVVYIIFVDKTGMSVSDLMYVLIEAGFSVYLVMFFDFLGIGGTIIYVGLWCSCFGYVFNRFNIMEQWFVPVLVGEMDWISSTEREFFLEDNYGEKGVIEYQKYTSPERRQKAISDIKSLGYSDKQSVVSMLSKVLTIEKDWYVRVRYERFASLLAEIEFDYNDYFFNKDFKYGCVLCKKMALFNPADRLSQDEVFLKKYGSKSLLAFRLLDVNDKMLDKAFADLKGADMKEKKEMVEILFKLAVSDDGIKNDEWSFLQSVMAVCFNKHWVDYYNKRYAPLRTEFDYKTNSSASSSSLAVSQLTQYYSVLGLEQTASVEEVQRAYRKMALEFHPDLPKNAGRVDFCEQRMAAINEAYAKLLN